MLTRIFALFMLFLAVFAVNAQEEIPDVMEYVVISDSVINLRSEPSTSGSILGRAEPGTTLFIYSENSDTPGWLKVYREGEDDAYVADYLVERAPMRFYDPLQEPIVILTGRGRQVTEIIELPQGAYRIDATVNDNAFILSQIAVEGDCRDTSVLNELDFEKSSLSVSALLVSSGCSLIFEADNVDGNWILEIRDLLDIEALANSTITLENGSSITGTGRQLTMPTILPVGLWTISAQVDDRAFILRSNVLTGECDDTVIFNEFAEEPLELEAVYRSETDNDPGCIIFWGTDNVEGDWELSFEKLR
jgi:hypothetical protein